ncbi:MAG: ABC transporter substrate-binding protein [Dehalococcoidia bacterium]|nr:ABC transporter substrate-binding protein [Dehalococcoidia bacterium]
MNLRLNHFLIAVLLAVITSATLSGCSSEPTLTESPTSVPTSAPLPTSPSAPPAATAEPTATAEPSPTAIPTVTPEPTATPIPTPTAIPYPAVSGIVDVSNTSWPRDIETSDGLVRLEEPPQRILSYSLGHDEILLALVNKGRFAAVGPFTGNPAYSNVSDFVADMPIYEKGVENVLAADPDLVIVSKYTDADIVSLIKEAGVPVVRPALENSAEGNIPNILLMGYMLGVEDRALELVAEIEYRLSLVKDRVPPAGSSDRPVVIAVTRYSDSMYVAGEGTTESGIIKTAGGVNAGERDGLSGHQKVSVESIAAMDPEVILITQPVDFGAGELHDDLLAHPALASVRAVMDSAVMIVDSRKYTTLSHWNVRGIEETAFLLYPDKFADIEFADFEPYTGE